MTKERPGIAIIGMACKFPGAPDLETFCSNLERGVDAVTEVPPGRWDQVFYDPSSDANDRIYCRRGGFLGTSVHFDPVPFGIMPIAAEGAEPDQMLALELVASALRDAGLDANGELPRETTAVILGRGGYLGIRGARATQHVATAQQLIMSVAKLQPGISNRQLAALKESFIAQLGHYGPDTAIGLVPNIAASRIANRFDFGGPAYNIDAACASSLIAVDNAVQELESGRADLVITGGMHLCDDLSFWNVFSRLGAISRSQQIRPFDRRADGLLIGEGIGILVLARRADAERRGNRMYALIRGTGTASDGRGKSLMQPRPEGQMLALERAWRAAGFDPATIGLLEAHGTGTPDGDRTELRTVARFFGAKLQAQPGLGSVKSMIGHTMPAAGAAGLIKTALALHYGFLPPTLHCDEPHELVESSGFRLILASEPWPDDLPRRAGINAFGFGGINAHVVLEAAPIGTIGTIAPPRPEMADMLLLEADSPQSLLTALQAGNCAVPPGPYRLAIERPTTERCELASKLIRRGKRWGGRNGIWYAPGGLAQERGRIVFLFPGVDGLFEPQIEDIAAHLGDAPPRHHDARDDLLTVGAGIIGLGRWLTDILETLGIRPDALAGHSIGEWTGMVVSGIHTAEESDRFVEQMLPSLRLEVPGVIFAAAGCGVEQGKLAIEGLVQISVSHDNCPHQIILCGIEPSIDTSLDRLRSQGVLCEKLQFRSGFHSPLLEPYLAPFRDHFEHFSHRPPSIPLWSATTLSPYPKEAEALGQLFIDHLTHPVRFRELTERLYDTGFRVFIQVGIGRLVGFVEDTLKGRPHVAATALVGKCSGLTQLRRLVTELWCEGYPVRLEKVGLKIQRADTDTRPAKGISLELGTPLGLLRDIPEGIGATSSLPLMPPEAMASSPVLTGFAEVRDALASMSQEVIQAWSNRQRPSVVSAEQPSRLGSRQLSRTERYSLAAIPELIDHCFVRQPREWECLADRFPVVPLTRSIDTLLEVAKELVPELTPIALERIRANRWIEVEPPVEVQLNADFDGEDRVHIRIGDYLEGTVVLGQSYPSPPAPRPLEVGHFAEPCITALQYYADRWTFHGSAFRGIVDIGPMSEKGVHGVLECLPARGSLLDAAGQLAGYWCTAHTDKDRLALPYRIDRISLYSEHPAPGRRFEANVHILELTDIWQRADIEIYHHDALWALMEGLEDRRFQSDEHVFKVSQYPECSAAAIIRPEGYSLVTESWHTSASRYFIARLYLGAEELTEYRDKQVRAQRSWILGRVAAKDAVRHLLWEQGYGDLYPIEVQVRNDDAGRPMVSGPWDADLRVSLAHKESVAVAIIAEGVDVGIDLEMIEPRNKEFVNAAFLDEEIALLPPADRDEWLTRLWVAKEAVSKARSKGLPGNPREIVLTATDGERLFVDGLWIATCREKNYIVGWTDHTAVWRPTARRMAG